MTDETKLFSPLLPKTAHPLLARVRYLAHSIPLIEGSSGVTALISEFLDYRLLWDIPRACELGDISLLRYIARRQKLHPVAWAKDEPLYRAWQFSEATVVAANDCNLEVLLWLLSEYDTESTVVKAVDEAAKRGHLYFLQCLDIFHERTFWSGDGIYHAVANNHLETAQWLAENTSSLQRWRHVRGVAQSGNLAMIRWLAAIGAQAASEAFTNAAAVGDIGTLDVMAQYWSTSIRRSCLDGAATYGHLDAMKWLLTRGTTCSSAAITGAASNGHMDVLEFISGNKIRRSPSAWYNRPLWTAAAADQAAANGHLDAIKKFFVPRAVGFTIAAMNDAAANGHLNIVEWLKHYPPRRITRAAMDGAASNGHLEVVKWLHDHHEGCTKAAMDGAAKNNHARVVRWLHKNRSEGCTAAAMDGAAGNGHLEMIQWLHENRKEGCTARAMNNAAAGGHLDVVKWLHDSRTEGCTVAAINRAADAGYLEVMKWLHEHRQEGCSSAAIEFAAANGRMDIVEWLVMECGCAYTERAMVNAATNGHFDIILFFHSKGMSRVTSEMALGAATGGHLEILQWLILHHDSHVNTWSVYATAVENNHYFCAQWLKDEVLENNGDPPAGTMDEGSHMLSYFS